MPMFSLSADQPSRVAPWRASWIAEKDVYQCHLRSCLAGFLTGAALLVPAAFFAARLDPGPAMSAPSKVTRTAEVARQQQAEAAPTVKTRPVATVRLPPPTVPGVGFQSKDSRQPIPDAAGGSAISGALADVPPLVAPQGITISREAQDTHLAAALELIASGDFDQARAMLRRSELHGRPEADFLLAESYDPIVLAAIGMTAQPADVDQARRHYMKALEGGLAAAEWRIEALK
jgi:hypothetical protein